MAGEERTFNGIKCPNCGAMVADTLDASKVDGK